MSNNNRDKEEEEEKEKQQKQKQLLDQLRLLNRLLKSQEKGEKITFDFDNPHVAKEMDLLQDALRKKLGKGEAEGDES
jgi:hypothetical protein